VLCFFPAVGDSPFYATFPLTILDNDASRIAFVFSEIEKYTRIFI